MKPIDIKDFEKSLANNERDNEKEVNNSVSSSDMESKDADALSESKGDVAEEKRVEAKEKDQKEVSNGPKPEPEDDPDEAESEPEKSEDDKSWLKLDPDLLKREKIPINPEMLPSKGKMYKSQLYARKLNAIQMKELSKLTKDNVDRVVDNIISKNITGVDFKDLMKSDKLWLLYFLRAITYNDYPYKVRGVCDSCEEKSWVEYQLKDLLVTYYNGEIEDLVLPNGDKISFKFPTVKDEQEGEAIKNNPGYIELIDSDLMGTIDFIREINNKRISLYEAYSYFIRGKGSALDYAHYITHIKDKVFGCRPGAKFKCSCGGDIYAEIPLDATFFLPDLK